MNDRIIIFLKENLEQFLDIINTIKKDAPFGVEYISFNNLTTVKFRSLLKEISHPQIYFGVDPGFYKQIQEKLNSFLKSILEMPFSNYIFIYQETKFMFEHKFILGKSTCFYFSSDIDYQTQVNYFIIHQLQLFEKSIISSRLTEYIADSFKEVVYSEILIKKNNEIKQLNNELVEKNRIDSLTNLYNRKALFNFLEKEQKRTRRALWRLHGNNLIGNMYESIDKNNTFEHIPRGSINDHFGIYSIMLIDIDNFKHINDTYGHLMGDKVLRTLGYFILKENILRENDIAGRFGGEEFIILLPETSAHNAQEPALRLVKKFKNNTFTDPDENKFSVSLSIGISEYHIADKTNNEIINRADKALYYAKKQGKDRIIIYEDYVIDIEAL